MKIRIFIESVCRFKTKKQVQLRNLARSTLYAVRVVAVSRTGESEAASLEFRTPPRPAVPYPHELRLLKRTPESALVAWTPLDPPPQPAPCATVAKNRFLGNKDPKSLFFLKSGAEKSKDVSRPFTACVWFQGSV